MLKETASTCTWHRSLHRLWDIPFPELPFWRFRRLLGRSHCFFHSPCHGRRWCFWCGRTLGQFLLQSSRHGCSGISASSQQLWWLWTWTIIISILFLFDCRSPRRCLPLAKRSSGTFLDLFPWTGTRFYLLYLKRERKLRHRPLGTNRLNKKPIRNDEMGFRLHVNSNAVTISIWICKHNLFFPRTRTPTNKWKLTVPSSFAHWFLFQLEPTVGFSPLPPLVRRYQMSPLYPFLSQLQGQRCLRLILQIPL